MRNSRSTTTGSTPAALQGPVWMTVTGTREPSTPKTWLIPSFLPMRPIISFPSLQFDLNIDASRQVEFPKSIDGLLSRIEYVEQALVGADLELFARFLVYMRRAKHCKALHPRWQGDRASHPSASALDGLNDLLDRL